MEACQTLLKLPSDVSEDLDERRRLEALLRRLRKAKLLRELRGRSSVVTYIELPPKP